VHLVGFITRTALQLLVKYYSYLATVKQMDKYDVNVRQYFITLWRNH